MNLATAQSTTRAREVGIRKIVGSTRGTLIRQFLFESLVMSLISLALAVVLIQLILPMFNQLIRKQLDIQNLLDPFNIFLKKTMWLLLKEPFLFNESTIREFGWTDPVGMKVRRMGDSNDPATGEYTIIGVVKDFHYESLHRDIDSFIY